jgi:hypothetical protein
VTALAETWLPPSTSQVINALVSALLLGFLAVESWSGRGHGQASFVLALAVVVSQLVVPQTGSYNLVLLLLPAVVALHRLSTGARKRTPLVLTGQALVWADLLIVPWLLWPFVRQQGWLAVDQVIVPLLLTIALVVSRRSWP